MPTKKRDRSSSESDESDSGSDSSEQSEDDLDSEESEAEDTDSESSEEEPDDPEDLDYEEKKAAKTKRWTFNDALRWQVIKKTAHKRENFNTKKYKSVYSCPPCRRPIAAKRIDGSIEFPKHRFRSKKKGTYKKLKAVALDHYPPLAGRQEALRNRGASATEIRNDHDDPNQLRALCKVCNESHAFETRKKVPDYTSDSDEDGYVTDPAETCNAGKYTPYRRPPKGGGGGGSKLGGNGKPAKKKLKTVK